MIIYIILHSDERERGKFDSNLNFVFEKENTEVDAWVAGLDEAEMEKAIGEAAVALKRRRDLETSKVEAADGRRVKGTYLEICLTLLGLMQPEETISRAMKRIKTEDGGIVSPKGKGTKHPLKSSPRVELITDLADQLISSGLTGIYGMVYEAIEAVVSLWEYQSSDGAVHGPFSYSSIAQWKQQGYFTGASAVPMRRVLDMNKKNKHEVAETSRRGRDGPNPGDSGSDSDGSRGGKRKRVKFADESVSKDEKSSAVDDLMNDLDDDDDDIVEEEVKAKTKEKDSELAGSVEGPSSERLLSLAALTASFDSSGRGPWVMSDEVVGFEERDDDDDDVANVV
jgi:hypothetical protein